MNVFFKIKRKILYEIKLRLCCSLPSLDYLKKQNTRFMHPIGIVIVKAAKIGKNCTIGQNVTIGCGKIGKDNRGVPIIGDNVVIYPNSTVVGEITIGDNVIIGCNSVVIKDVPEGVTVAGNPSKIIKQ